jgi:hypothetical protein
MTSSSLRKTERFFDNHYIRYEESIVGQCPRHYSPMVLSDSETTYRYPNIPIKRDGVKAALTY